MTFPDMFYIYSQLLHWQTGEQKHISKGQKNCVKSPDFVIAETTSRQGFIFLMFQVKLCYLYELTRLGQCTCLNAFSGTPVFILRLSPRINTHWFAQIYFPPNKLGRVSGLIVYREQLFVRNKEIHGIHATRMNGFVAVPDTSPALCR